MLQNEGKKANRRSVFAVPAYALSVFLALCGALTVTASAITLATCKKHAYVNLAFVPGALLVVTGVVTLALICCCASKKRLFALAPVFGVVCAIAAIGQGSRGLLCETDDTYSAGPANKASCFSLRTTMCGAWPVVAAGNGTAAALHPNPLPNTLVLVGGVLALVVSVVVVVLVCLLAKPTAPPLYNVNANEQKPVELDIAIVPGGARLPPMPVSSGGAKSLKSNRTSTSHSIAFAPPGSGMLPPVDGQAQPIDINIDNNNAVNANTDVRQDGDGAGDTTQSSRRGCSGGSCSGPSRSGRSGGSSTGRTSSRSGRNGRDSCSRTPVQKPMSTRPTALALGAKPQVVHIPGTANTPPININISNVNTANANTNAEQNVAGGKRKDDSSLSSESIRYPTGPSTMPKPEESSTAGLAPPIMPPSVAMQPPAYPPPYPYVGRNTTLVIVKKH